MLHDILFRASMIPWHWYAFLYRIGIISAARATELADRRYPTVSD